MLAYEVKVCTADKKSAGTANSLYLVLVGEKLASKLFTFKNSSRRLILQRGQTDTFQVATPPLGGLKSVRVAHCPRRRHQDAESAEDNSRNSANWYLFQIVLTSLANKEKIHFLCRKWVEPSPSPKQLNFIELPISN